MDGGLFESNGLRSVEQLPLPPGFRFNPTDEELVWHYLKRKADSESFQIPVIAEVELYKFDPWDLPGKALFGEKEWFFFSPRDRKYPKGARPNRAAASGYWKATGTDKAINMSAHGVGGHRFKVGVKKSLVFYRGRAPKGVKTNWIMHEYRLAEGVGPSASHHRRGSQRLDDWVLCRIYEKHSSLAQRAASQEHDMIMESMLAPQEMDDLRTEPVTEEDDVVDITSETMITFPTSGMVSSNIPGSIAPDLLQSSTAPAMTNVIWNSLQHAMAGTSHHNLDNKVRFMQELATASSQPSLNYMQRQFQPIHDPHRSVNSGFSCHRPPSHIGNHSASSENGDRSTMFQYFAAGSAEASLFAAPAGFDHLPADQSLYPWDGFSYGAAPGHNNNFS